MKDNQKKTVTGEWKLETWQKPLNVSQIMHGVPRSLHIGQKFLPSFPTWTLYRILFRNFCFIFVKRIAIFRSLGFSKNEKNTPGNTWWSSPVFDFPPFSLVKRIWQLKKSGNPEIPGTRQQRLELNHRSLHSKSDTFTLNPGAMTPQIQNRGKTGEKLINKINNG